MQFFKQPQITNKAFKRNRQVKWMKNKKHLVRASERASKLNKYRTSDEQAILKASLVAHYKISTKWINILDSRKKKPNGWWLKCRKWIWREDEEDKHRGRILSIHTICHNRMCRSIYIIHCIVNYDFKCEHLPSAWHFSFSSLSLSLHFYFW